ncbi:uncharacterized protein IL334_006605 [Kwoniella shivajii]|uniref:BZIP domain-containing protein n=1 Tax=Kwoniella shivajii TaxID=564305 RepID=A0ABZ1D713_9TREE|nr:hypothetical protein IL334_006605 [Kwoniella shivajii]
MFIADAGSWNPKGRPLPGGGTSTGFESKPPALPMDQLNLPMPDFLAMGGNTFSTGKPGSTFPKTTQNQAVTKNVYSQPIDVYSNVQGRTTDNESKLGYPPNWGWGYDYKKPSLMERIFGRKVDWDEEQYYSHGNPYQPEIKTPHALYPTPQPSSEIPLRPHYPKYQSRKFEPKPFPVNYDYLSRSDRRVIFKQRQKEERMWREAERQQQKMFKARLKEYEREEKAKLKLEKKILKEQEKEALWHYRHPSKPYPIPKHGPYNTVRKPPTSINPVAEPNEDHNPYNFMLLPAAEFGVRRPFDPRLGGNEKWPNMSRTMTHAILDMNKEERLHAYHASTIQTPNW